MGWKSWAGAGIGAGAGFLVGGPAGAMAGGSAGYGLGAGMEGSFDRDARARGQYGNVNQANMGVPGFQGQYDQYGQLAQQYGQQGSSFRRDQQGLGHILAAEARGNGVGQQLVGMQARTAADRASAQQFGAVAGARPGMQAMASRNAMLGSAMAQSAVGEQAALGSAQMTLGAQQAYGQHLQGARAQDINQHQVNNQAQLEAYQQRLGLSELHQRGGIEAERLRTDRYRALLGVPTQGEIVAGGLQGLGSAIFTGGKKKPV